MRGEDTKQAAMFSYLTLERRIPADHPLRAIRRLTDRALERIEWGTGQAVLGDGAGVDCAGAAVAGVAADGSVLGALGAATDGAIELQPAVPVVRGSGDGRRGVGRDGVHQEPGAADRGRGEPAVAGGGAGRGAGEAVVERRAFHRGWDADSSLGGEPELSGEERPAGSRPGIGTWGRGAAARQGGIEDRP